MKTIDRDLLIRKYIDTDIAKFNNSDVKIVLENLKQNILKMPSADRPQGDFVSKRYLLAEIDDLADEFSEVDENGLHGERWCGILDSKGIIVNAPSVSNRPQEWIPCKERLPKEAEPILVTINGKTFFAPFGINEESSKELGTVAWMPLPAPWEGEEDEF